MRMTPPGPNHPPAEPGETPPAPPSYQGERQQESSLFEALTLIPQQAVRTEQATVVADPNTNSLIVVADPATQRIYKQLIEMLDQRRPQVLIETTIVTLDTSRGFSLGVEIARQDEFTIGGRTVETLLFSSFGLSEIDEETGRLQIRPGTGFNGAIVSPDIADVVIRALATSGRAKVVSAPRVLVNDNATGFISSIAEQPFTSVNAFDTIATTSFGGFVGAGTDITVRPQIAEGDYLRLGFNVALRSFTGQGSNGIPPPRQSNVVDSEVTVPDGHTIIVGGIKQSDFSETINAVPILGELPILEYLFSSRDRTNAESTLFVFIRPRILRDDQLEDLKYFSRRDAKHAGLEDNASPTSRPLLMR